MAVNIFECFFIGLGILSVGFLIKLLYDSFLDSSFRKRVEDIIFLIIVLSICFMISVLLGVIAKLIWVTVIT
jgi:hypothetical protein